MTSIRVLRTFLAVAEEGSFTAAANRVALTQAAVGLQMRNLERDLNRPLFRRQGKLVSLNAQGRALIPLASQMTALYERMRQADDGDATLTGSANLGAVVSALPKLVKATLALKHRHPGIDLHVGAAKSIELMAQVEAGRLDCAIVVRDPTLVRPTLAWTPLYRERMAMLAPARTNATSVRALIDNHPFIRFSRAEQTGQLVERTLRKLHLRPREYLELNSMDAIVDLVRAALGVAILPLPPGSPWLADPALRIMELPARTEQRDISLVQLRTHPRPALISAIGRQLRRDLAP